MRGLGFLPGDPTTPPPPPPGVVVDFSHSLDLAKNIRARDLGKITLKDLINEEVFTYQLSVNAAIALDIPVASFDGELSRIVFIQEYAKFKEVSDNIQKVRVGVAIRWIANIKKISLEANTTSMPFIAASAQFGHVEAWSIFQVVGLSSKRITNLTPAPKTLNIESYSEMNDALQKIKNLIWDGSTIVSPVIISALGEVRERTEHRLLESVATTFALSNIRYRVPLKDALEEVKKLNLEQSTLFQNVLKSVYQDLTGAESENARPSESSGSKAEELLSGFELGDDALSIRSRNDK